MKIISVVGARPNFMKIAPFIKAIEHHNKNFIPSPHPPFSPSTTAQGSGLRAQGEDNNNFIDHLLVHTGQHYDDRMSDHFFKELGIPEADINLGVGSGTHAEQIGQTMIEFEKVLKTEKPDWVVVVGDVNATLACSVTAKKENIKCCHIEAGLRSGDMTMPEEINRLVTDRLSDLLLTPDRLSGDNLRKEGVPEHKIKLVGNIMIDTLETNRAKASKLSIDQIIAKNLLIPPQFNPPLGGQEGDHPLGGQWGDHPLGGQGGGNRHSQGPNISAPASGNYCLLTLHRPSNVDKSEVLTPIVDLLVNEIANLLPVLWPIHPRTLKQLREFGLFDKVVSHPYIYLIDPLGYIDMLRLNMDAKLVLTDSGGLQEECTVLGTPCLTMRWNTERPVTLREYGGLSVLVGNNVERIREEFLASLKLSRIPKRPELWDGNTAHRCLKAILEFRCER